MPWSKSSPRAGRTGVTTVTVTCAGVGLQHVGERRAALRRRRRRLAAGDARSRSGRRRLGTACGDVLDRASGEGVGRRPSPSVTTSGPLTAPAGHGHHHALGASTLGATSSPRVAPEEGDARRRREARPRRGAAREPGVGEPPAQLAQALDRGDARAAASRTRRRGAGPCAGAGRADGEEHSSCALVRRSMGLKPSVPAYGVS